MLGLLGAVPKRPFEHAVPFVSLFLRYTYLPDGGRLKDVWHDKAVQVTVAGGTLNSFLASNIPGFSSGFSVVFGLACSFVKVYLLLCTTVERDLGCGVLCRPNVLRTIEESWLPTFSVLLVEQCGSTFSTLVNLPPEHTALRARVTGALTFL